MPLRDRLAAQIRATGPLSVVQYMSACLHDPQDGYYATRPALGEAGDFVTAPLISQMFGELIGLWLVESWSRLGAPSPFRLVEIGPGDGTLMSDILRAARLSPEFLAAADLWLVELSEPLRRLQQARLGASTATWSRSLAEVPDGAPLLLVANELLDCLPPRQFVRVGETWRERVVGLDAAGNLVFGLGAAVSDLESQDAPQGAVREVSAAQAALGDELGARLARDGGAALLIDYGRDTPGFGDTLQALKRHRKVDVLAEPGTADLTVHADFPAVAAAARAQGAATGPILTQGEFLVRLGLGARAEALIAGRPDKSDQIARQVERLAGPDQMGDLFKVCCIHGPGVALPAFETPS